MDLCVGAVSRRVVEEAAKLRVPQIVASRRQVDIGGGYIGMDQAELVDTVRYFSNGATKVVRDHGGPGQAEDDAPTWEASFEADVQAGFDALHVDVCKVPSDKQHDVLEFVVNAFADHVAIEIGGERDDDDTNWSLTHEAIQLGCLPSHVVVDLGGHIHADRQRGVPRSPDDVWERTCLYRGKGIRTKAHNMDWMGGRLRYADVLDAYNVAPEFGNVEVDAWLRFMEPRDAQELLQLGWDSGWATRWFDAGEGTMFERSRCGARYVLATDDGRRLIDRYDVFDDDVREAIRDALARG